MYATGGPGRTSYGSPPASSAPDQSAPSRPTVSTNVDNFDANQHANGSASPPPTTTPDALNFYRQRDPAQPTLLPPATSISGPAHSFNAPNVRSASGPLLTSPRSAKSNPSLTTQKRSVKDLAARFDQASQQEPIAAFPRSGVRSASSSAGLPSARSRVTSPNAPDPKPSPAPRARLQKPPPHKRKQSSEGGEQAKVESAILPPSSPTATAPAPSFLPSQNPPIQQTNHNFLFGEVQSGSSGPSAVGYGIPRPRARRGSEGSMRLPNPMFSADAWSSRPTGAPPFKIDDAASAMERDLLAMRSRPHQRSTSDMSNLQSMYSTPRNLQSLHNVLSPSLVQDLDHRKTTQPQFHQYRPARPRTATQEQTSHTSQDNTRPITPPLVQSFHDLDVTPSRYSSREPRLKAYIKEPSPKKSPPLRSSRPRQQVSSIAHPSDVPLLNNEHGEPSEASSFQDQPASHVAQMAEPHTPLRMPGSFDQAAAGIITPDDAPGQYFGEPSAPADTPTAQPHAGLQLSSAIYQRKPVQRLHVDVPRLAGASKSLLPTPSNEVDDGSTDFEDDTPISANVHTSGRSELASTSVQVSPQARPKDELQSRSFGATAASTTDHVPWSASTAASIPTSAEGDNGGTIQIMLGDTPIEEREDHTWKTKPGANTSPFTPLIGANGEISPVYAQTRRQGPQFSRRLAADSETYSTIYHIYQQYEESGSLSPQMAEELGKHLNTDQGVSPQEALEGFMQTFSDASAPQEFDEYSRHERQSVPLFVDDGSRRGTPMSHQETSSDVRLSRGTDFEDEDSAPNLAHPPTSLGRTHMPHDRHVLRVNNSELEDPYKDRTHVRGSTHTTDSSISLQPSLPEIHDTGGGLGLSVEGVSPMSSESVSFIQASNSNTLLGSIDHTSSSAATERTMLRETASTVPESHGYDAVQRSKIPSHAEMNLPPELALPPDPVSQIPPGEDSAILNSNRQAPGSEKERQLTRRKHIIKELIDTEYKHHQDMAVLEDIYMGTVTSCSSLQSDDVRILFGNTPQIVRVSRQLADGLKESARGVYTKPRDQRFTTKRRTEGQRSSFSTSNSSQTEAEVNDEERDKKTTIGETLLQHMTQLDKAYGEYMKNHRQANERVLKVQKDAKVQMWLQECGNYAGDLTSAWSLDALLVKPTQRMAKYPLLLKDLVDTTPADHPDFTALELAKKGVESILTRIDEAKRREELIERVMNSNNNKKDLDMAKGISKAFGRRAEKLRQQVGASEHSDDKDYHAVATKFTGHQLKLQLVMRDVQMYITRAEEFIRHNIRVAERLESTIDVGPSQAPEIESKWRRYATTVRELSTIAFADHVSAIQSRCIEPLKTVLKLMDRTQKLMGKRKKRLLDYAKYKSLVDRGEKVDKTTKEQGEVYLGLNDSLKDELPKLYNLLSRLVMTCMHNLVELQAQWFDTWYKKVGGVLEERQIRTLDSATIEETFRRDFQYPETDALTLGICNGSLKSETANFLSSTTTERDSTSKRPSTLGSNGRTTSMNSQSGHILANPDYNRSSASSQTMLPTGNTNPRPSTESGHRTNLSNGYVPHQRMRSGSGNAHPYPQAHATPQRPSNGPGGTFFFTPSPPVATANAQSYEAAGRYQQTERPTSNSTYYTAVPSAHSREQFAGPTPPVRGTRVFSSAMPLSESPVDQRPHRSSSPAPQAVSGRDEQSDVLFLAASLFDFNIDPTRTEAGFPYLTYMPGEIFDVIAVKGELWLARNQDDTRRTIGWIWEKHFAKLSSNDEEYA